MRYRPEIDGLRAIAVIPVIFFHADFPFFKGGFVGVDVFFVISGFLITSIILNDLDKNSFSLKRFYERRAKRILPALFLIASVCIPFAYFWLMPRDLKDFSESLISILTFSSNFLFWQERHYFAPAAELKPLLHTWSLAVEEQFYILFPLFMLATKAVRMKWISLFLWTVFWGSLLLAHWASTVKSGQGSFYLLPTRGWEILMGALGAFFLRGKNVKNNDFLAFSGLVLIIISVCFFDKNIPFPSFWALIPTIGTILIIMFANEKGYLARLLSSRPLVLVGLMSYSAYLWHQPIFAFAKHRAFSFPSYSLRVSLILLTFVLSFLSWKWVEIPFRSNKIPKKIGFSLIGIFGAGILVSGLLGITKEGFPSRLSKPALAFLSASDDIEIYSEPVLNQNFSENLSLADLPVMGDPENIVGFLLGDSHAAAVGASLQKELFQKGIGLKVAWYGGCPPIRGLFRKDQGLDHGCPEFNEKLFSILKKHEELNKVVVVARFTQYLEGTSFDNGEGGIEPGESGKLEGIDFKGKNQPEDLRRSFIQKKYAQGIQSFLNLGKEVILVYPIPEVGWDAPMYAAKKAFFNNSREPISTSFLIFKNRNQRTIEAFDSLGKREKLKRVYPHEILCDSLIENRCVVTDGMKSFYSDYDHLSKFGGKLISIKIAEKLTLRED